jgi:hypothetical protein
VKVKSALRPPVLGSEILTVREPVPQPLVVACTVLEPALDQVIEAEAPLLVTVAPEPPFHVQVPGVQLLPEAVKLYACPVWPPLGPLTETLGVVPPPPPPPPPVLIRMLMGFACSKVCETSAPRRSRMAGMYVPTAA